MAVTFDGQRPSCRSDVAGISLDVEKAGQCAKEEVSSSLLGKLAPRRHFYVTNIFLVFFLFFFFL